LNTFW